MPSPRQESRPALHAVQNGGDNDCYMYCRACADIVHCQIILAVCSSIPPKMGPSAVDRPSMDVKKDAVVVRTVSLSSSSSSTLDEHDEKEAHGQQIIIRNSSYQSNALAPFDSSAITKARDFVAFAGGCLRAYAKDMNPTQGPIKRRCFPSLCHGALVRTIRT